MGELQQQRNKNDFHFRQLQLIANNSRSFANESKSIIRNNLGLCMLFEIYFTFKNTVKDLMV